MSIPRKHLSLAMVKAHADVSAISVNARSSCSRPGYQDVVGMHRIFEDEL